VLLSCIVQEIRRVMVLPVRFFWGPFFLKQRVDFVRVLMGYKGMAPCGRELVTSSLHYPLSLSLPSRLQENEGPQPLESSSKPKSLFYTLADSKYIPKVPVQTEHFFLGSSAGIRQKDPFAVSSVRNPGPEFVFHEKK